MVLLAAVCGAIVSDEDLLRDSSIGRGDVASLK